MTKLRLDYLASPRKIFLQFDLDDFYDRGVVMGVVKFTEVTALRGQDGNDLETLLRAGKK